MDGILKKEMEEKLEDKRRKQVMDLKCVKVEEARLDSRVTNTHKWGMENWKNEWRGQKKKKKRKKGKGRGRKSVELECRNKRFNEYANEKHRDDSL